MFISHLSYRCLHSFPASFVQYIAENSSFFLPMENYVSRGRDTGHNRNFRMNSGQNRQFRQAGGLQTGAQMAAAHMQNSDRDRSFRDAATDHSAGKKILYLLLQYIAENSSFFVQTQNHASRGSRGSGRHQSEYPHQTRNFRQNSGQNRQRRETGGPQPAAPTAAAHVQNSGRGRSFRDPATRHSANPRGNGGDGGGSGRGGRDGAHYVARQPSSEPVATTTAIATSGRANRAAINSSSIVFRGSSTTSVTPIPGAPNQYGWSHHCSALFSWRMGSVVGGIQCLLVTAISIIFFFFFFVQ
ncbi:uncharacterized protein LOC131218728 isoform X1 [Magnolia sinica]|uniref:uncharacterized protein LOC131218728 isoform X1 n=1 Tax=Magnolia sinica TaxID=86752 RepID=UPI002658105D|nr:uncharacterized protein LOC131218728 isoform X1 [Magnolia sinica]